MPALNNTAGSPTPPQAMISFAVTLVQRVRSLIARGQINAASLLLPTLQKLCADQGDVAIIMAEIALARGDNASATVVIDRGLAATPQSVDLLVLRARLNLSNRDLVGAALAAADAVTADPLNARAKSILGQALVELGQMDQAATCLREALDDMPGDMAALTALTRAAPVEAEAAIRGALSHDNDNVGMRNALIGVLLARGNIDAATVEIKNLTVCGQADAQTALLAVQVAVDQENWSEAAALFSKSTLHLPRHA